MLELHQIETNSQMIAYSKIWQISHVIESPTVEYTLEYIQTMYIMLK